MSGERERSGIVITRDEQGNVFSGRFNGPMRVCKAPVVGGLDLHRALLSPSLELYLANRDLI